MLTSTQRGVSLVELMIGFAIATVLLLTGAPAFTAWLQNSQNRTAAESIMNALQLARLEAVKRNAVVRFHLTDATGRIAWNVGCVNVTAECPASIQRHVAEDGLPNARAGVSVARIPFPTPAGYFSVPIAPGTGLEGGVSFNGLGQMVAEGEDVARIDVTNAATINTRRFVVAITGGGQIRMCDPALSLASNPQGCS